MNKITASGYLVRDSDNYKLEGSYLTRFRLAIKSAYKKDEKWVEGETTFVNIKHFNDKPLTLKKGEKVMITGRLTQYKDNPLEIIAYDVKQIPKRAAVAETKVENCTPTVEPF